VAEPKHKVDGDLLLLFLQYSTFRIFVGSCVDEQKYLDVTDRGMEWVSFAQSNRKGQKKCDRGEKNGDGVNKNGDTSTI